MSSTYEIGDLVALDFTVKVGTTLTDATVALTITLPDGTTTSPAPTHVSVGTYHYDFPATQNGAHGFRWAATGAATAAQSGSFVIGGIVSLAEVKQQLRMTSTTDDAELQSYIDAVSAVIERQYGPIAAGSPQTWTASGGARAVLIPARPVSITSVLENGATLTTADYFTDLSAGIIYRGSSVWPLTWLPGVQNVVITYAAGGGVHPDVSLAARIIVQQLWESQRGPKPLPLQGSPDLMVAPGFPYLIPRGAYELLEGIRSAMGPA